MYTPFKALTYSRNISPSRFCLFFASLLQNSPHIWPKNCDCACRRFCSSQVYTPSRRLAGRRSWKPITNFWVSRHVSKLWWWETISRFSLSCSVFNPMYREFHVLFGRFEIKIMDRGQMTAASAINREIRYKSFFHFFPFHPLQTAYLFSQGELCIPLWPRKTRRNAYALQTLGF